VEIDTLPGATRSAPYTAQLEASGGSEPYKWKKVGKLPSYGSARVPICGSV
jgi:hypothetical protein